MKESDVRRPAQAWAKRLSAIGHEIKDLAKNANLRATVALGVVLLAWVMADRLISYEKVSTISPFGGLTSSRTSSLGLSSACFLFGRLDVVPSSFMRSLARFQSCWNLSNGSSSQIST